MPTLAILDDVIPEQLAERPGELHPMRVVWSGTDLEALRREAGALRPDVLALDLSRLGSDPVAESQSLAALTGAQLVLMLYDFAPSSLIREAARSGARPVKTPIRLTALRTQMTSVIVRGIFNTSSEALSAAPPVAASAEAEDPPQRPTVKLPRRFSRAQLGRLAEIESSVECECPNHLSELLLQLSAFEDYARACQNRDDKDAAMHALLHTKTVQARALMEEALTALLVHEKIVL